MNNEKYNKLMNGIRSRLDKETELIRSNTDLTETAKAAHLTELKKKADAEAQALKSQRREEIQSRHDELYSKFIPLRFSATDSDADKAVKQNLYQQAIEKAQATKDFDELINLIAQARKTANKILLQACGFVAYETGYINEARSVLAEGNSTREKEFDELIDLSFSIENPTSKGMVEESFIFAI